MHLSPQISKDFHFKFYYRGYTLNVNKQDAVIAYLTIAQVYCDDSTRNCGLILGVLIKFDIILNVIFTIDNKSITKPSHVQVHEKKKKVNFSYS